MVYWNFGDFIKSYFFRTISKLDTSNTDKMSRLKIVTVSSYAKINSRKICQNLDPQIFTPKSNLQRATERRSLKRFCVMKIRVLLCGWVNLRSQSLKIF